MLKRTFVIGDVHGCSATLRRLVDSQLHPVPGDRICFLGDLIDRGPDSKGVLDFFLELRGRGLSVGSIRGNHEEMYLKACVDKYYQKLWASNGGQAALDSFQARVPDGIPLVYRDLINSFPLFILLEGFVIVHASLNFDIPNPLEDSNAMLWSRSVYVDQQKLGGRRLICGHTPVSRRRIEASILNGKIMLDNGCVFGGQPEMGSLAALELMSMQVYYQENIDCQM